VGIDVEYWWLRYGRRATDTTGVRAVVAGSGSIVFSNVNSELPTVISARCFCKVMTRYNVTDMFARAARDDPSGTGSSVPGYSKNWCKIWQPDLIDHSDPPLDREVDGVVYHYSILPTLDEIPTPQMGLQPSTDSTGTLHCLASWILDSENMTNRQIEDIFLECPEEYAELYQEAVRRVESTVTSLREDRHITNVPLEDILLRSSSDQKECSLLVHGA
jgi:hypothetical protein